MFRGVFEISMDAKGRLAIPARLRDSLHEVSGGNLIATIDLISPCVVIYPLPQWELVEQKMQEVPTLKPEVRRIHRMLMGYASDLQPDGSGRVLMPASLREYGALEKTLVLVGQGTKLELWSSERWDAETQVSLGSIAAGNPIPEEFSDVPF